ncbi:MAG: DUF4339 domain-containing protein, partial [Opitutaceae bacterium]|nr:DUF4339 domain-containing protein [Opitutaceae bacterium]
MSANQHEFYIRSASEDEARGPFTLAQLAGLAAGGQLARDTLYYEADSEQWAAIGGNAALCASLFPEAAALGGAAASDGAAASPPPDARMRAGRDGKGAGDGEAAASSGGGDAAA